MYKIEFHYSNYRSVDPYLAEVIPRYTRLAYDYHTDTGGHTRYFIADITEEEAIMLMLVSDKMIIRKHNPMYRVEFSSTNYPAAIKLISKVCPRTRVDTRTMYKDGQLIGYCLLSDITDEEATILQLSSNVLTVVKIKSE